jgi:periplasmic divalent cation tolerance protein
MLVYVTAADSEEAARLGRTLVGERLAACANIVAGARSIYRWEGALAEETEALLILKTTEERLPALTERIKALHGYTLPCIVALPIAGGNPAYLDWIANEVGV